MAEVDTNRGCTTFSSRISVMVPYRETTTDIKDIRHNTVDTQELIFRRLLKLNILR